MTWRLVLIVMGVTGAGKSTLAEGLRDRLGWPFQEGDALHPPANVRKMQAGVPLTDEDRSPWLAAIKSWIDARVLAGEPGLITCSALKRAYRDGLIDGRPQVRVLYLKADAATLDARLRQRRGHFMPATLLESQLRTLEEPGADERPLVVAMHGSQAENLRAALDVLAAATDGFSRPR
jgi:carbohydrate kinase (thermoresistant glucokinase family)